MWQKKHRMNCECCPVSLLGNKDCHEFRFSIVRIVIRVYNVISSLGLSLSLYLSLYLSLSLSFCSSGHVSSSLWSDVPKVPRVTLSGCSPIVTVIVIVIVFVFVFVIVIVFLFVRSCLLITLITCLKGHKSLRVLFCSVFQQWLGRSQSQGNL